MVVKKTLFNYRAAKLTIAALVAVAALIVPSAAEAVQAVAVELPAGEQVRTGEYFPLLLTLRGEEQAQAQVRVTIGRLTFARLVTVSPGTTRKFPVQVVALEEHPEIDIEVRSGAQSWRYPRFARLLMDRLRVLPRSEHLVCILSGSGKQELTWLFQRSGVTAVEVSPRVEFPAEVFGVFDLIAFEGSLWNTMSLEVHRAIETHVESGGTVCISEDQKIPFDRTSWGLGKVFFVNPEQRRLLGRPAQRNAVKERILSGLGLSGPREAQRLSASEAAQGFEPLPRFLESRAAWLAYLFVCALATCAAALCSLLRLWSRKLTAVLMPAVGLGLSAAFALIAPAGDAAYERVTLVLTAANSDTALARSYVRLYGFKDSGRRTHALGASGLILPARRMTGWGGPRGASLVLSNGTDASVSGLSLYRDGAAVFEIGRPFTLSGGFNLSARRAAGKLRLTNNSGLDLTSCVLVFSGKVTEFGELRFGQTVELDAAGEEFIAGYLRRRFDTDTREGRTLAAFTESCWKRHLRPARLYLVGWAGGGEAPDGYVQASVPPAMWIVSLRPER